MMRFKSFIAEIDHDDSVYLKHVSADVAQQPLDSTWSPLPVKAPFWKTGYSIHWKDNPYGIGYRVAVAYAKKVVVYMELDNFLAKVPGGSLHGLEVDSLSSRPSVRGTGLVLRTYEALVESGQVLFSSKSQTSGSRALWQKLVQSEHVVPFVLAEGSAATWYQRRYGDKTDHPKVLLTGSLEAMIEEAYASNETRWVALPKDLEGLDRLREGAINVG